MTASTGPAQADTAYATAIERERQQLLAAAYLIATEPDRAESLVQLTLAQLYEQWPVPDPRLESLRLLVAAARNDRRLPWAEQSRVELVDRAATSNGPAILDDLRRLPFDERVVIVAEQFVELPTTQIAVVLERASEEIIELSRRAHIALTARRTERDAPGTIAAELALTVADPLQPVSPTTEDLARGRRLRQRHRRQRWAVVAAAVVALVLVASYVVSRPTAPAVAPAPTVTSVPSEPSATPSPAACDPVEPACQGQRLIAWQSAMTDLVTSDVDPTAGYFTAVEVENPRQSGVPTIWTPRGGSISLRFYRPGAATEVLIHFATDEQHALTCGQTTGNTCFSHVFMDGNRFYLTRTLSEKTGLEVQGSTDGTQVVTAIAHNTGRGETHPMNNSALMKVLQDQRLQFP